MTPFDIYRKHVDDAEFTLIAQGVEGREYVDTSPLITGEEYIYKVVAVRDGVLRFSNEFSVVAGLEGISAEGGTVSEVTIDDVVYVLHIFNENDEFVVSGSGEVEYLIVGGGGAGGRFNVGGGGGGGGVLTGSIML